MSKSLENLLDFSIVGEQLLRRRGSTKQLPEVLDFLLPKEGSKSFVFGTPIDDYTVGDKANSYIELAIIHGSSTSAHSFLRSFNKVQATSFQNVTSLGFDTSSFSNAILESNQITQKDIIKRLDNDVLGSDNPVDLSSCFCPSCAVLNVLSVDSEPLIAFAPIEVPLYADLSVNIDVDDTFFLHSNPAADHTIYLDFNGFSIGSTPWENGGSMSLSPFYDDLGLSEVREEIQNIWNRVSADFAPFNINVTTEEPDLEDLRNRGGNDLRWGIRVALTSNQNLDNLDAFGNPQLITNAGGGGTAYYNSFNWLNDDVAFVFNQGEYAASETVSHEVGHALNLRHDGTNTRTNNPTYYEGHGAGEISWGSIMGAPFIGNQENVTTWSKGEYNDANNIEDDLSIITSENGFGYRIDDHGNNFNSASSLSYSDISSLNLNKLDILSHGLIERSNDLDCFVFETIGGVLDLNISNVVTAYVDNNNVYEKRYLNPRGANLDISATLYNSDRSVVATSNPETLLSASFNSIRLNRGTYFLKVKGVGTGTPFDANPTGYTSYASLGEYLINGFIISDASLGVIESSQTYMLKVGEKNLTLIGSRGINGTGNNLANTIIGNNSNNVINGKGGGDEMIGKIGNDIYYVNDKNDKVVERANQGVDTVRSSINYTLSANVENLKLLGSDSINGTGNKLNNKITGNFANNIIDGKKGADKMAGKKGKDIYYVNDKNDKVTEAADQGTDTVRTSISYTLENNVENLSLVSEKAIDGSGNYLNNRIVGNNNKNNLKGKGGKDTIIGKHGKDILTGGGNADLFRYLSVDDSGTNYATRDRITDFSIEDTIDLSKIDANQDVSGNQEFVFIGSDSFSGAGQVRFNNGILSMSTNDDFRANLSVELEGVTELFASSFIL